MPFEAFTTSNGEVGENPVFTFGEKMRVLRKLRELEFACLDRGASPEGAVYLVYKRALDYYDSQWPNDEGEFRNMILGMHERKLKRIMSEKRRRDEWDNGYRDSHGDRLG